MTQSENQLVNSMMELVKLDNFNLTVKKNENEIVFNFVANVGENNNNNNNNNGNKNEMNVTMNNNNNDNLVWTKKRPKNKVSKNGKNQKYFTPYMTFIKAIREKNPKLNPVDAKRVGSNFLKEFPDTLKVSKNKFNKIVNTVNFDYYV